MDPLYFLGLIMDQLWFHNDSGSTYLSIWAGPIQKSLFWAQLIQCLKNMLKDLTAIGIVILCLG